MTFQTEPAREKAILVGVPLPDVTDADNEASLDELRQLVKTLGFDVIGRLSQRRPSLAGPTILGEGKLKELAALTGGTGVVPRPGKKKAEGPLPAEEPDTELADVVVFDCELSPSQLSNLQKATGAEVLDRTGVIVEIFSRHARTREARLQVEVARLRYLAPRLREAGTRVEDRKGMAGESSLELDRRKIRDRIAQLKDEIAAIQKQQAEGRSQRSEQHTVALVGYTNAGKSSLMRALTGSDVLVEDKLFATLDTTVRRLSPATVPPILISDTVGFIKKLPHDLVASFRSTLEEAAGADLLLFVVDASDPSFRSQLQVTHEVLGSIGVGDLPSRLVLNKCDKLEPAAVALLQAEFPDAIVMSAKQASDVERLRLMLVAFFEEGMVEEDILVPYASQKAAGQLRAVGRVLSETHGDTGTVLRVRGDRGELASVKRQWGL